MESGELKVMQHRFFLAIKENHQVVFFESKAKALESFIEKVALPGKHKSPF